jgi:hypothetical protein
VKDRLGSENIDVKTLFANPAIAYSTVDEYNPLQKRISKDIADAIKASRSTAQVLEPPLH